MKNEQKALERARTIARKKGLIVSKNAFRPGYTVVLPNNSTYAAINEAELLSYLRGY